MSTDPDAVPASTARLEAVYREHHALVWRVLARLGVPDARLGDGVHDVFMVVARRLHEFEGRASLKTWLYAIALRVAQGMRRDAARERRLEEALAVVPADAARPHDRMEAARVLRQMLDGIDDEKRAVFVMIELEGMTGAEVAEVLSVPMATVYSRLRGARARLERIVRRQRAGRAGR